VGERERESEREIERDFWNFTIYHLPITIYQLPFTNYHVPFTLTPYKKKFS